MDPSSFLGDVPCSSLPGALHTYVATLMDVSTPGADRKPQLRVVLPSSAPTSCGVRVAFSSVIPGHFYVGEVDGYDREACESNATPDCIQPQGAPSGVVTTGGRTMVDATNKPMAPRWTARCGDPTKQPPTDGRISDDPEVPTPSLSFHEVVLRGCQTLSGSASRTTIVLQAAVIRGPLACGDQPGQLNSLRIVPDDSALGTKQVSCDSTTTFDSITPERTYGFAVYGSEAGAFAATWGTRCLATPLTGVQMTASCEPFSTTGSLSVGSASLLSSAGAVCASGSSALGSSPAAAGGAAGTTAEGTSNTVMSYEAVVSDAASRTSGLLDCGTDLRFSQLAPGAYTLDVTAHRTDGTLGFRTRCQGSVAPGQVSAAHCTRMD